MSEHVQKLRSIRFRLLQLLRGVDALLAEMRERSEPAPEDRPRNLLNVGAGAVHVDTDSFEVLVRGRVVHRADNLTRAIAHAQWRADRIAAAGDVVHGYDDVLDKAVEGLAWDIGLSTPDAALLRQAEREVGDG